MAQIPTGLVVGDANPVDFRLVLTKQQMRDMNDLKMPRNGNNSGITKYFDLCIDDNRVYVYDRSVDKNEETGRFRETNVYEQPGTEETLGPVKSSGDLDKINISEDGTMNVNSISLDKLKNTEDVKLIINGGSAPIIEGV